jgi:hypothetical protein
MKTNRRLTQFAGAAVLAAATLVATAAHADQLSDIKKKGELVCGVLGTDGFIQEAPGQRGPVDIASNVHSQNGVILAEHDSGPLRLFVRGSGFNEARNNGTPLQTNGTRLWRYATGGD